jgi:hypothetical protein
MYAIGYVYHLADIVGHVKPLIIFIGLKKLERGKHDK